jgi:hypothetical protein
MQTLSNIITLLANIAAFWSLFKCENALRNNRGELVLR